MHLLTLEFLEINKFLLRLEHQFEASDLVLNTDVTLSLRVSYIILLISFANRIYSESKGSFQDVYHCQCD